MKDIINEKGSVDTPIYEINGVKYQIIASMSVGIKAIETIDVVKNLTTGETKKIKRDKLYNYTRKC